MAMTNMIWRVLPWGIADKKNIIDGSKVAEGDILIGLPSSGIHSNGYSLVRKIFFDKMDMDVADYVEELGTTLGDALIMPTRIYVKACKALFGKFDIHGIVHMTGGGFYENIPRILRTAWVRKSKRVPGKFGNFQVY